ncbi:MAG: MoaD/ThiS family protein [Candidatus Nanopelagicales bacterium]
MPTVRYFAAAREAAGVADEEVAAGSTVELGAILADRHGPRMAQVLAISSLVCDGVRLGPDDAVPADACVDVLPPFAGG